MTEVVAPLSHRLAGSALPGDEPASGRFTAAIACVVFACCSADHYAYAAAADVTLVVSGAWEVLGRGDGGEEGTGSMAKTVMQMVEAAAAEVPGLDPTEARRRQEADPNTLIVDVRDSANRRASGMAAGAIAVSVGTLPFGADTEVPEAWRDPRLQDRSRPVITICDLGPMSALAAKTLKDMGFTDVAYIEGGTRAWKDAGLPTEPPTDA